jgi:hypothetical protein
MQTGIDRFKVIVRGKGREKRREGQRGSLRKKE